jgi:hypothetical protein
MDFADESVGRNPLAHGIGVEKRAINFLGRRTDDAVQTDGVGGNDISFL